MKGIICNSCGQEMELNETHCHIPDFFLDVWDCNYRLMRSRYFDGGRIKCEVLPFNLPKEWVKYVLDSCNGCISRSGIYPLPGSIKEWVSLKLSIKNEAIIKNVEKNISAFIECLYNKSK